MIWFDLYTIHITCTLSLDTGTYRQNCEFQLQLPYLIRITNFVVQIQFTSVKINEQRILAMSFEENQWDLFLIRNPIHVYDNRKTLV